VAVSVLAGLALGVLLVPRAPRPDQTPPALPEVELLGQPLQLDDQAPQRALARVRRFAAGQLSVRLPSGKSRSFRLGELGAAIDKVRLAQLVRDARDATSPLRQRRRRSGSQGPIVLPVPLVIDAERAVPRLLLLKDELDRLPSDARLDLERKQLVREVHGRLLDVDATLHNIQLALTRGERDAALVFETRKPKRVASELGNVKFDAVLGWFETPYSRARRYQARTYNLRLAASKLDGTVLLPGEVFDFNELAGPRDEASGYKVAPVIAEGELVDGIGGGTCQISGTLHAAVFFAGLEIVERHPHTRPSSYIKMGLDATVVYPTINFRFRNNLDSPLVVHETVKDGMVRTEILGPRRELTVTLIRRIESAIAYEEVQRLDPDLPEAERVLVQRGVPGFRLHRYRIVRRGSHAVRERYDDVYPPTAQIIGVGSGDGARRAGPPQDDPTPEYLADELLVMTQDARATRAASGEDAPQMQQWREPGKFGTRGWTEQAGMPVWQRRSETETEARE
jgi:vancomycin resistance protein YoaR